MKKSPTNSNRWPLTQTHKSAIINAWQRGIAVKEIAKSTYPIGINQVYDVLITARKNGEIK